MNGGPYWIRQAEISQKNVEAERVVSCFRSINYQDPTNQKNQEQVEIALAWSFLFYMFRCVVRCLSFIVHAVLFCWVCFQMASGKCTPEATTKVTRSASDMYVFHMCTHVIFTFSFSKRLYYSVCVSKSKSEFL